MTLIFRHAKDSLEAASHLTPVELHVIVGLLVFALAAAFRGNWRSVLPLAAVTVAAFAGELWDFIEDLQRLGYWRWADSIADIAATTALPLVVHVVGRFWIARPLLSDRLARRESKQDKR